jgi:diaminopimelate decarboxylase
MQNLLPTTARVDERGGLWLAGHAAGELAARFGTPLYIFDEATFRGRARAYRAARARHYPATGQTAYASKAYLCTTIAELVEDEGLDLDVVSGGELYVALRAGFPATRIHFHGNNKTPEELAYAVGSGIGRIVVDNFHELKLLSGIASQRASSEPIRIWLRLAPGVQAHTHAHIQTGQEDTKFGLSIAAGDAERAVAAAMRCAGIELVGLHAHIGSQIYDPESLAQAAHRLAEFAAAMAARHGFRLRELSPGGGWGVPMTETDPPAPIEPYVQTVCSAVIDGCRSHGLDLPHLVLEPGRSLVAAAGVALYRVGTRKKIPGVRTYVSVDGGMADNIRPALYGAQYAALLIPGDGAAELTEREPETVTIAGKYCESGDVLIRDIALPQPQAGDLLAIPMAGAYTLSMASNYNLSLRPAVVMISEGGPRLIQRRERYDDLVARDVAEGSATAGSANGRRFAKYQALGNDYIVIDPAAWPAPPDPATIRRICDRTRGPGADGVLWGPYSAEPFGLRLFNPDGSEFEKSGNGLRIFARYLWDRRLPSGPHFAIATPAGPVTAHVLDAAGAAIAMDLGRITFDSREIGIAGDPREIVEQEVTVASHPFRITAVGVGNPHCVVFADTRTAADAGSLGELTELARFFGPLLEHLPLYPNRTNVQFGRVLDEHTLVIAIWERGAGYTLASGTSSCAAAAAAIRTGRCASPMTVQMPGGEMLVEIAPDWSVRLTGAVSPVFAGELTWEDAG